MRLETLAVHAGRKIDSDTGAVAPPIHLSTIFERSADGDYPRGFVYARYGNPNRSALEEAMAALEGGASAAAFSSGNAATAAVCRALGPDALIVAPNDLFYGTRQLFNGTMSEWGQRAMFIEMNDLAAVRQALELKPRLLWLETPSNPMLRITDIAAVGELAQRAGVRVICDNTWATPILQNPLSSGADAVLHSATKYLSGHSDTSAGIVVVKREDDFFRRLRGIQRTEGAVSSPFDSWLVHRGLRSLPARMRHHCDTARAVADFLAEHPAVERVHYPGLQNHIGYETASAQMRAAGGMLSFQIRGGRDAAFTIAARVRIFTRAGSLGGVESLIQHHASIEGPGSQTPENLLRLSIGLENAQDLIDDLKQALEPN
jgi:cystathionine gamma-synthase